MKASCSPLPDSFRHASFLDYDWRSLIKASGLSFSGRRCFWQFFTARTIAIARATRPEEAVVTGTIAGLPAQLAEEPLKGPVLVLIGLGLAGRVGRAAVKPQDLLATA